MVLTRTMKELWLFGGADTLRDGQSAEEKERRERMEEEEREVVEGMQRWLVGFGRRMNNKMNGNSAEVEDEVEEATPMSTG